MFSSAVLTNCLRGDVGLLDLPSCPVAALVNLYLWTLTIDPHRLIMVFGRLQH